MKAMFCAPPLSVLALLLSMGAPLAQAPALTPIEQYVDKNGATSVASMQFTSLRCASLYLFAANMLRADTQHPESAKLAALFESSSSRMTMIAAGSDATEAFIRDQVARMTEMYGARARAEKINIGNIAKDPLISSDMTWCKAFADKLQ